MKYLVLRRNAIKYIHVNSCVRRNFHAIIMNVKIYAILGNVNLVLFSRRMYYFALVESIVWQPSLQMVKLEVHVLILFQHVKVFVERSYHVGQKVCLICV